MKHKRKLLLLSLFISILLFGGNYADASNTKNENLFETIQEAQTETNSKIVLEYEEKIKEEVGIVTSKDKVSQSAVETDEETLKKTSLESNKSETSNIQTKSLSNQNTLAIIKGWKFDGTNWKYLDSSGNPVISKWIWAPILDENGNNTNKYNWKYFNYNGININQFYKENGMVWLSQAGPENEYARGWWLNPENGFKYYFRLSSGTRVIGRQFIDNNWRFFRTTGTLATGRQFVQGGWMYFRDKTGTQTFGWQFYNGSWRYNDPEKLGHEYQSVWKFMPITGESDKRSWKFFNKNGENIYEIYSEKGRSYMSQPGPSQGYARGWFTHPQNNNNYYFRLSSATMATRWQYINGMWRFFADSGEQLFGLQTVNGSVVFLRAGTGSHALGRQFIDGKWMDFGEYYNYTIEKYVDSNGKVSDILSDTETIKPFILVLDPGHGAGAAHNRGGLLFNEGDQNYYFSQKIINEASKYQNIIVKTTRPNILDDPSFEERAGLGAGADLFASLHTNASDSYVRGVEIWGSHSNTQVGHDFATDIVNTWSSLLNTPNRRVMYDYRDSNQILRNLFYPDNTKEDTWFIYKGNTAKEKILLESVFHTNYQDSSVFLKYQDTLAKKFMENVAKHFGLKLK